jgi:hypothetical protein
MPAKHLHRKKAIVTKEEEYFGTLTERHLPGNVGYNPEDIGEFGKELKHHHHKSAIKKVHKHVIGLGTIIPQKISRPGTVPRNIGLFGGKEGSPEWYREMDRIVRKYTGWDSLIQMCRNYPTLMVSKGSSADSSQAIYMMRAAYKFVTGREAYPTENWDLSRKRRKK